MLKREDRRDKEVREREDAGCTCRGKSDEQDRVAAQRHIEQMGNCVGSIGGNFMFGFLIALATRRCDSGWCGE
jgi:hypothetical protein